MGSSMQTIIMVVSVIIMVLFIIVSLIYHYQESKRWWAILELYRDQQEKQYQSLKEILDTLHQHTYILAQIKQGMK